VARCCRASRARGALGLPAVDAHGFLQEKGEARYRAVLEVPATRGRIVDRNGEALAISTPVKSVWAIPTT
jgi:cell division protein FtsI/penicillin-binding protein 2